MDKTTLGGFFIPPALQQDMISLRDSKLSPELKAKYTPFPWERSEGVNTSEGSR